MPQKFTPVEVDVGDAELLNEPDGHCLVEYEAHGIAVIRIGTSCKRPTATSSGWGVMLAHEEKSVHVSFPAYPQEAWDCRVAEGDRYGACAVLVQRERWTAFAVHGPMKEQPPVATSEPPVTTPMKHRIDLETIELAVTVLAHLNRLDLRDIEFWRDGKPVDPQPTEQQIDDFKFTGLSNRDFATWWNEDGAWPEWHTKEPTT